MPHTDPPDPLVRVGRDITAGDRWAAVGDAYADGIDGPYHRHRLDVVEALLPPLAGADVVDFGCGEGVLIRRMRALGAASVDGIDLDAGLLARAGAGGGARRLALGGVERLAEVERADCVVAANVAAYFTDEDDDRFYREVARILPPGGCLVITHSNELFDLFTLNAFTVAFFRRHFGCDPAPLLTRPREPDRATFNVRENPLAYPEKLRRHGLEVARTEFMSHHPLPPLLDDRDWDAIDTREYDDTLAVAPGDRWKLMFRCSMFGVRAVRGDTPRPGA